MQLSLFLKYGSTTVVYTMKQSHVLGRVCVIEADYARHQLQPAEAPADSVWSTRHKTERMVLRGWGNQPRLFVYILEEDILKYILRVLAWLLDPVAKAHWLA